MKPSFLHCCNKNLGFSYIRTDIILEPWFQNRISSDFIEIVYICI